MGWFLFVLVLCKIISHCQSVVFCQPEFSMPLLSLLQNAGGVVELELEAVLTGMDDGCSR